MKYPIGAVICAGLMFAGAQAFAGDAMQGDASHHQMMKDCMAKHAAANDGMSKADVKKACSDEMAMPKDHSSATKAPTDSPKDSDKIGTGDTSNK